MTGIVEFNQNQGKSFSIGDDKIDDLPVEPVPQRQPSLGIDAALDIHDGTHGDLRVDFVFTPSECLSNFREHDQLMARNEALATVRRKYPPRSAADENCDQHQQDDDAANDDDGGYVHCLAKEMDYAISDRHAGSSCDDSLDDGQRASLRHVGDRLCDDLLALLDLGGLLFVDHGSLIATT